MNPDPRRENGAIVPSAARPRRRGAGIRRVLVATLCGRGGGLARCDSGNALVEMAIVTPVLVLLFMGVADFGRAAGEAQQLAGAARAGVQWALATVGQTGVFTDDMLANVITAARQDAGDPSLAVTAVRICRCPSAPTTAVSCESGCSGADPRVYVSVEATRSFDLMFTYPGVPAALALSGTAEMRLQ